MSSALALTLLVAAGLGAVPVPQRAGRAEIMKETRRYHVRLAEAGVPALRSGSDDFIRASQVVPDPGGGLLVVERGWQRVYRVTPDGTVDVLVEPGRQKEGFERPVVIAADSRHVLTYDPRGLVLQVSSADLEPVARFTALAFNAAGSVELAGDKLFGLGWGVILAEDPVSDSRLLDDAWQRRHWRNDCRIFRVPWREKTRQPDRVVCDPDLVNPNSKVTGSGDLLYHSGKVFAVASSTPWLYILEVGDTEVDETKEDDEAGEDPRTSGWFRKVSLLGPGEVFVPLTRNQIEAEVAGRARDMSTSWANRDRYRWFQGMVRAGADVGVVFRLGDGKQSRFVVDVYDVEGVKKAANLPIPVPKRGPRAGVSPVNGLDGNDYLLVQEVNDQRENTFQELYRIEVVEETDEVVSETRSEGETRAGHVGSGD